MVACPCCEWLLTSTQALDSDLVRLLGPRCKLFKAYPNLCRVLPDDQCSHRPALWSGLSPTLSTPESSVPWQLFSRKVRLCSTGSTKFSLLVSLSSGFDAEPVTLASLRHSRSAQASSTICSCELNDPRIVRAHCNPCRLAVPTVRACRPRGRFRP